MYNKFAIEPKKKIKINTLLKSESPKISCDYFLQIKKVADLALSKDNIGSIPSENKEVLSKISSISAGEVEEVFSKYGEEGLFKFNLLIMSHSEDEFNHFNSVIKSELQYSDLFGNYEDLKIDNDTIIQNEKVSLFNTNVLQPSFSRKMYNPGRHFGYLVYGIGGPRILISHPFQGINSKIETYDIYNNSIDVVTSLGLRGYFGTFMFLDYLPGLNYNINGVPAWVVWFSLIASHSDLVLYIKEYEKGFSSSQRMEIEYTSNRVQKKIIEIPHSELKWATVPKSDADNILYVGSDGEMTQDEWYKMEAMHSKPFIDNFTNLSFPKDRYIQINEDNTIREFAINHEIYKYDER